MRDDNAQQLLAKVMDWQDEETVRHLVPTLQLLADYKYDHYQRFGPGKRFIESLALWLNQFEPPIDRGIALQFVMEELVYFSEKELSHLVQTAHPDLIMQERIRLVAEEQDIPRHRVGKIILHPRFKELGLKSLYLGLSDGARTNELRRASDGEISNEQIWQAYELGAEKIKDMANELGVSLKQLGFPSGTPKFNLIWLLDDFSGSGNTYIRFDGESSQYKGKIKKIYEHLHRGELVDRSHYEVFLLLYVATRQAIDHIEYWAERFTSENGYKPLQVRVLCPIERQVAVTNTSTRRSAILLNKPQYCDQTVVDKHFLVGGNDDARVGFAKCALPVVLSHNTPNNSIYILWGPESCQFFGLFPRVSRHREF
jgi:hypothetical protein